MTKLQNAMLYILVFSIILFSFKIPEMFLKRQDNRLEMEIYTSNKKKNTINVEAEKIYLVKALHEIEGGKTVMITTPEKMYVLTEKKMDIRTGITRNIYEEVKKLEEYQVLKDMPIIENAHYQIGLINKSYSNEEAEYRIQNITLEIQNHIYILNMENQTNKILYFAFEKNNLYDDNPQKILENYIQYLNLYVMDDWEYVVDTDNKIYAMQSIKADLKIALTENDENWMLSVHVLS